MPGSSEGRGFGRLLKLGGTAAALITYLQSTGTIVALLAAGVISFRAFASDHWPVAVASLAVFVALGSVIGTSLVIARINQAKDFAIAEAYAELQNSYMSFETEAIRLCSESIKSGGRLPREDLLRLKAAHEAYLTQICRTARTVFVKKKPRKGRIGANIQRIIVVEGPEAELLYKPIVRSYTDQERIEYDEEIQRNPIKVRENYMYRTIFDGHQKNAYFIHHDVLEVLRDVGPKDREPNRHCAGFYRSVIIFPIYGNLNQAINPNGLNAPINQRLDPIAQCRGKDVFGLLCVDSQRRNAFREGKNKRWKYDMNIMRQLTDYAFSSFRLLRMIEASRQHNPQEPTRRRT
jgi:hypothetical protein